MNRESDVPIHPASGLWRLGLFALFCLLVPAAILVYQVQTPSDGARVSKRPDAWRPDGVYLHVYLQGKNGLHEDDLLVAVNGKPIEAWAAGAFHLSSFIVAWDMTPPPIYSVVRDGQVVDVLVAPVRQPIAAILYEHRGVLLFALITQIITILVVLLRPNNPTARALFVWGLSSSHFYIWALYRQIPDLVSGLGFWLFTLPASFFWLTNWAAGVHLTMIFPRPLPTVLRRPSLVLLPYLVIFTLYGVYSALAWSMALNTLDWIRMEGQGESLAAIFLFIPMILILIHQYRSDKAESSQKKIRLVVYAGLICSSLTVVSYLLPPLLGLPALDANLVGLVLLLLPAAIALAILRYQLFDIDVIIRRTLVYTVLTGLLAMAYFGAVVTLQTVSRAITGQGQNQLVTVLSTLAIAALFVPLRGQVQAFIDLRFYRRKYDAARTLAGFAAGARDEVELEQLSGRLVEVVQDSMQPAHISLWLKPPAARVYASWERLA